MAGLPEIHSCANSRCRATFRRLGEGIISVFAIDDPEAWGLPETARQKVVWLCQQCASSFCVRVDQSRHKIQVAHKPVRSARLAL
jgi:hypothetical protein